MEKSQQKRKKGEASQMLNEILTTQFWYMESNSLRMFLDNVQSVDSNGTLYDEQVISAILLTGSDGDKDKKPYEIKNGIANIKIQGPLMKRVPRIISLFFGIKGMEQIGQEFEQAMDDSDVKAVMLDVDSPGGSVDGTMALADIIYNARGKKPIMTFADGSITSAAYWIGSSADYIALADQTTRAGSIGVVGVHMEYSDMAKKLGIGIHVFSSGKFKKMGNQFEKLSKDDIKYFDNQFKYLHNLFIEGVAKNLGTPKNKLNKDAKEAKVFYGQQSIEAGLVDAVMTKAEAMEKLDNVINGNEKFERALTINLQGGDNDMDLEAKIKQLEEDLKAKNDEIQALKSDKETERFQEKIEALESEKTDLEAKVEGLETEIVQLKQDKKDLVGLADIGEKALDEIKAEIKKMSIALEGDNLNEAMLEKELAAFANDFDYLSTKRDKLEVQMGKTFKAGSFEPDDKKTETGKAAEEIDIGRKIGSANQNIKLVADNSK